MSSPSSPPHTASNNNNTNSSSYITYRQRSPPHHLQNPKTIVPTEFDPNFLRWMKGLDTNRQRKDMMEREPDDKLKKKVFTSSYQGSRHQRHHDLNQQNFAKHHQSQNQNSNKNQQNEASSSSSPSHFLHHHTEIPALDKDKLQQTRRDRSERMFKVAQTLGTLRQLSPSRFMLTEKDYELKPDDEGYEKVYTKRQQMNAFREKMSKNSPRTVIIENAEQKQQRKKKQQQQKQISNGETNDNNEEGLPTISARDRQKQQEDESRSSATAFQQLHAQRTSAAMRCFARGFQRVVTSAPSSSSTKKLGNSSGSNKNNGFMVGGSSH